MLLDRLHVFRNTPSPRGIRLPASGSCERQFGPVEHRVFAEEEVQQVMGMR